MASPRMLGMAALCLLGCGGGPGPSPSPRSTTAGFDTATAVGGTVGGFSTGTSGSSGSQGGSTLDGPLGFAPQNAFAEGTATSVVTVEVTDGDPGCMETGAYTAVRITLPTSGSATYGTVSVDAGATIELLRGQPGMLSVADTASSGQVTLNDVGGATLGGNFSAQMLDADGGDAGPLSGIFSASVCN